MRAGALSFLFFPVEAQGGGRYKSERRLHPLDSISIGRRRCAVLCCWTLLLLLAEIYVLYRASSAAFTLGAVWLLAMTKGKKKRGDGQVVISSARTAQHMERKDDI
jgi:O-antigen/teichoic acid export membrane protein